jgi:hypothetical protein
MIQVSKKYETTSKVFFVKFFLKYGQLHGYVSSWLDQNHIWT